MATPAAHKDAIPFELPTASGGKQSLAAALAKGPVLLAFFKVGCPTCQFALPFLERIYQHFKSQDAQVWGISQDAAADTVKFAQTYGLTFPMLLDEKPYKVSKEYRIEFVPSLFLVAPDGKVEISGDGFVKQELLAIHRSLAKRYAAAPPPIFSDGETIPEFKPG